MLQKAYCRKRVENSANLSSQEKDLLLFTYKTLPAVTFLSMWIPNLILSPDLLKNEIAKLQINPIEDPPEDDPDGEDRVDEDRLFDLVDKKCEIAATTAALEHSVRILAHNMD